MYKQDYMPICANRTGEKLKSVQGVVIHYTAAPGGRAAAVRNNFVRWANQDPVKYASCHAIVDINGDILQIMPYDEVAWHVGAKKYTKIGNYFVNHVAEPNYCLIGIEMCHPDASGKSTDETRTAAIALCRDLCEQYNLNPMVDVYLHNDITGKWCHKYYCDNPVEWQKFREEI